MQVISLGVAWYYQSWVIQSYYSIKKKVRINFEDKVATENCMFSISSYPFLKLTTHNFFQNIIFPVYCYCMEKLTYIVVSDHLRAFKFVKLIFLGSYNYRQLLFKIVMTMKEPQFLNNL